MLRQARFFEKNSTHKRPLKNRGLLGGLALSFLLTATAATPGYGIQTHLNDEATISAVGIDTNTSNMPAQTVTPKQSNQKQIADNNLDWSKRVVSPRAVDDGTLITVPIIDKPNDLAIQLPEKNIVAPENPKSGNDPITETPKTGEGETPQEPRYPNETPQLDSQHFNPPSKEETLESELLETPQNVGLVQVIITDKDGDKKLRCAGTAISKSWVVTSAHCFENGSSKIEVYNTGDDLTNPIEATLQETHPGWSPTNNIASYDLALIHVPTLPEGTKPVPIAGAGRPFDSFVKGYGFGLHAYNPETKTWIREKKGNFFSLTLPIQDQETCTSGLIGEPIICAGEPYDPNRVEPTTDFCIGDSGSPVGTWVDGRFIAMGIESGSSIGHANPTWLDTNPHQRCGYAPSEITSLKHHISYINDVIAPSGEQVEVINLPIGEQKKDDELLANNENDSFVSKQLKMSIAPSTSGFSDGTRIALSLAKARFAINPAAGKHVLLASNEKFADALASAVLQDNAILLLTDEKEIPNSVLSQIYSMGTEQVSVLGGKSVIDDTAVHPLLEAGIKVQRISGASRISTAVGISTLADTKTEGAILVRAYGNGTAAFADSLAAGGVSARKGWPIFLSNKDELDELTAEALEGREHVVIVGGESAIGPAVREEAQKIVQNVHTATGVDRIETATILSDMPVLQNGESDRSVIIIDGFSEHSWQGGFSVTGLAADLNAPILLTNQATKGKDQIERLKEMKPQGGASFVCISDEKICDIFYEAWAQ